MPKNRFNHQVVHYWPFQCGKSAVVLYVVCFGVSFGVVYFGIFRLISVFQTTAILKFANSQHYPPAPFAKCIGSLMRL